MSIDEKIAVSYTVVGRFITMISTKIEITV